MDKISEAHLDSINLPNSFKSGCSAGATKEAKIGFLDVKSDLIKESVLAI